MLSAKVLADSISPCGARLTTFEVTIPRIVLAEFNTHRMFSRNSASSRAIPVEKMMARVEQDPFVPVYWGKNQKGMQAEQELTAQEQAKAESAWLVARHEAIRNAKGLLDIGVHKQITNRLLEPWMWQTIIFSATELDNFYALRNHPMAQPEIQKPAALLLAAYEASKPMALDAGEWHLPLVIGIDLFPTAEGWMRTSPDGASTHGDMSAQEWLYWARVSAGRCARVSYLTHDGKRDLGADTGLCDGLVANGHMSPTEHPAVALSAEEWNTWSYEQYLAWRDQRVPVGNFWGWKQLRKTLDHEHNFKLRG